MVNKQTLQYILEVSLKMAQMRSLTPLLNCATEAAIELVGAERGFVVLKGSDDDDMDFRIQQGERGEELAFRNVRDHVSTSVLKQVFETGEPLVIKDAMKSSLFGTRESVIMLRLRSIMCAPMIVGGEILGAIYVENRSESNRFAQDDLVPLVLFANQAAVATKNTMINDQLQQAYKVLQETDKIKTDFISIAGHELRTPLTVIRGYADVLQKLVPENEKIARIVEGITAGQQRLHEIVEGMLDVAKIEQGGLQIPQSYVRLGEVIGEMISEFQSPLQERVLTLRVEGVDALPRIQGDFELLSKAFRNIIINAIKYTPDGGSIFVWGRERRCEGQPGVEIAIEDTGVGIDPKNQALIFEKFYHPGDVDSHSSGTTEFGAVGPGLGLSIARGIVRAHQGEIRVESEGHDEATCPGSTFFVTLPVRPDKGVFSDVRRLIE